MVVSHFLKWVSTARVAERAAAAAALARAYVDYQLAFDDRCAAEAALTLLLDDPSPKVRLALSEALSLSRHAPPQIVKALAEDQPDVAAMVLARSPLLSDADLIDRVASGDMDVQCLVAMRPRLSMAVAAAIAEIAAAKPCLELLANDGAGIAALSFRRLAERHGDDPGLREALLADRRLPPDCRHLLLVKLGDALGRSPLVLALMGRNRAERVTREACLRASLTLIEHTASEEHPALVEHLRMRGDLTASFIIRAVAHGKIDFLGAVLVALTGQGTGRIRALLAGGRDVAVAAVLRKAGLAEATHAPILRALRVWRDVANGQRVAGAQEVSWLMLETVDAAAARGASKALDEIAALLKSIHLDALRENAREHALAIAAA